MTSEDPIVIICAKRTPLGSFRGALASFSAVQLGALAVRGALEATSLPVDLMSGLFMGCVLSSGLGQGPARQVVLGANLPPSIPATHINKVCGSAMQAILSGFQHLMTENQDAIVLAGGMESMSNVPYLLPHMREGSHLGHQSILDGLFYDGLEDAYQHKVMGLFAEETARKYNFSRDIQDDYVIQSAGRALEALRLDSLKPELIPVALKTGEIFATDEPPVRVKLEKIRTLKPAFGENGTITAATASSLADGAAVIAMTRLSTAEKIGMQPLAVIRGISVHAQEPQWFTTAPIQAVSKLSSRIGWFLGEVDLFEVNEAFAVVPLAFMHALNIPAQKVNVFGGACSLGHPLGVSGARIVVTLLNAMTQKSLKRGIATICIGGGEAMAIALERI